MSQASENSEVSLAKTRSQQLIDREKIIGIELWIAGASTNQVESFFGHVLLRFVNRNGNPLYDPTLICKALIPKKEESHIAEDPSNWDKFQERIAPYWHGNVGNYPVIWQVDPMASAIGDYLLREGRELDRYVIPTNAKSIARILDTLDR